MIPLIISMMNSIEEIFKIFNENEKSLNNVQSSKKIDLYINNSFKTVKDADI